MTNTSHSQSATSSPSAGAFDPTELTVYTDFIQGSAEWEDARRGILTASTIGRLITAKTVKVAENVESRALTRQLVAERITGRTDPNYASYEMEMGHVNEPIARDIYREHFAEVDEIPFMVREHGGVRVGFSPDGLVGHLGLLEIKSRNQKEQLSVILSGKIPDPNMAQLQCGLWVSGRAWIDYCSYSPGMPLYVIRVNAIPEWQNAIYKAAVKFEEKAALLIDAYKEAIEGFPMTEHNPQEIRF